jgi:uracil-DNA glycosylase
MRAVEGEGPARAKIMLVGEQPGNEEDLIGHPFVGPAGRVLDEAISLAGLERKNLFITNAVKHFKWEPRGKRRLHKKPDAGEIDACHVWLERELATYHPSAILRAQGERTEELRTQLTADLRMAAHIFSREQA